MKVLVTGATGFLGSHIAEELVHAGHDVRALVRKTSDTRFLRELGVELALGAVDGDEADLARAVRGVDAIVHAAGIVKARRFAEFHDVNAGGTRNLVGVARAHAPELRRFVYVSSLAAHGPSPDGRARPTDSEPRPQTHYGKSKLGGERFVLDAARDLPVTILRPPVIYGPRDTETLMLFQTASLRVFPLFGDGGYRFSVVFARDCARAVHDILIKDHPSGRIYTVDDGAQYSWAEMRTIVERALGVRALAVRVPVPVYQAAALGVELFARLSGKPAILTRDKVTDMRQRYNVCSSDAIGSELGWHHRVRLDEGARLTVDWYREHGWL